MAEDVDTVVIGGGLSGLTAADMLTTAGQRVRVVEADDQVGGRTRTDRQYEVRTEFGGEWIGPRHRQMLTLVRRFGLHAMPARQLGHPALWRGREGTSVGRLPPVPAGQKVALLRVCRMLDRLAGDIDPVQPWVSPDADRLDQIRVRSWLRQQGVAGDALHYLCSAMEALTSTDSRDMSLLHLLWWAARGGGILRMLYTTFASVIVEGAQSVSAELAGCLAQPVVFNTVVRRISHGDSVEVECGDGRGLRASRALITAPVGALGAIVFDPPLPRSLAALDELGGAPGTKVSALLPPYNKVSQRFAVGAGPLAGAWRLHRRVTGFAPPTTADSAEEVLFNDLASLFGALRDELAAPSIYRWSQQTHIPSCDIAFAPGQLTRHGPHLVRPHGRLHFAGAERSSWPNNMEGAVESGVRAAREILSA